jgi:hypothetical protein
MPDAVVPTDKAPAEAPGLDLLRELFIPASRTCCRVSTFKENVTDSPEKDGTARDTAEALLAPQSRGGSGKAILQDIKIVKTSRLRAIRQPSSASALLESFVTGQDLVPESAERVTSVSELTVPLRHIARRNESQDAVWCAWSRGVYIRFFSAVPSLHLSRERKRPGLQVTVYDEQGVMMSVIPYVHTARGWQRCA